jgi:hypothetical protein
MALPEAAANGALRAARMAHGKGLTGKANWLR